MKPRGEQEILEAETLLAQLQKVTTRGCENPHESRTSAATVVEIGKCEERDGGANCCCPHTFRTDRGYRTVNRFGWSYDRAPDPLYQFNANDVLDSVAEYLKWNERLSPELKAQMEEFFLVRWVADRVKAHVARGASLGDIGNIQNEEIRRKLWNYGAVFRQNWRQKVACCFSRDLRNQRAEQQTKADEGFREVKGWVLIQAISIRAQLIAQLQALITDIQ